MGSCCSTSPNNDAQTKASTAATNEPPAPAATAEATANPHFTPPSQSSPNQTQKSSSGSKSTPIGNVLGRPMEDVRATYTIGKELGRGQFGVTYLCNQKQSGGHYACKTISKRKLVNKGDIEDVKREVQIMHHLMGQPNIVELRGAYQD